MSTLTRRAMLRLMAAACATAPLGPTMALSASDRLGALLPTRELGDTGERVTCLGLGGYHIGWTTETLAQATIEAALEQGVRFFDTAESYGPHTSEERYGRYLTPKYRDAIFLMSKSTATTGDEARTHLDGTLKRLNTDVLDLWQIHALASPEDVDRRLAHGVLDVVLEAREQGRVRHLGFTGHASPYGHRRMLEKTADARPFAACQFPVNPVDAAAEHSFIRTLMPLLADRSMGALAMKTLADGRFFASKTMGDRTVWTSDDPVVPEALSLSDCIHFALSLPITVLITGAEKPAFIAEKAGMVRDFVKLDEAQRQALIDRVARFAEAGEVEYYKTRDPSA